jgi:hypothetical protein
MVSALSGGSAWSFYSQRVMVKQDTNDNSGQKLFRTDLLDRIQYLEGRVDDLLDEKQQLIMKGLSNEN